MKTNNFIPNFSLIKNANLSSYQFANKCIIYWQCVKILSTRKLFIFLVFFVLAKQSFTQPIAFCGIAPSNTATSQSSDSIYLDRFGNTYDKYILDDYYNGLSNNRSIVGYFDLRYDFTNTDLNIIPVIEDVFEYISNVLEQRVNTTGCSDVIPPSLIRILITESSDIDDPVQATGSPNYYLLNNRYNCDDVVANEVDLKMNGGLSDFGVDGIITLNDDPDYDWYLGTGNPSPTQVDFFTIILHEALHVFGFASRLTSSGVALDGVYSVWDQFIYTSSSYVNGGPQPSPTSLIISDCDENCWDLNSALFNSSQAFVTALSNNCSSSSSLDFIFGIDGLAPLLGGSGDIGNNLSHLNQKCNGQNIGYVMLPGLELGKKQRTITSPELNILCRLGYKTSSCDECYLAVFPEDDRYESYESCCETFISACEDQQLFLSFDELMCNDNSNDFTEITNYYLDSGSDLQVTVTSTGFQITPTEQGNHLLFYTVKSCDCRMLDGQVYIYTGPCTNCEEIDPCENLVCIDDFEEFETGFGINSVHVQSVGSFWVTNNGDNSIDICEANNNNKFLHLGSSPSNREGLIMKLSEPLDPGCTLHVSFDASTIEKNTYQWFVSEEAPCSYNEAYINPNGLPSDCGTYLFEPYLIQDILVTNTPNLLDLPCALDPNFVTYLFDWPNSYDFPVNYLILFPGAKNNYHPNNYLDNITVTKDCLNPLFDYSVDNENCLQFQFDPIYSHSSFDHHWNFGDSNESTNESPVHTFSSAGTFNVAHTVTDNCGNSATSSQELVLDCCDNYTVTAANTTWTTSSSIPNNGVFHILTIAHGASLSIGPGVTLKFCPGGYMELEEGSFVRNQGTLTSLGDFSWNGVYATGVQSANQSSSFAHNPTSYGFIAQGYFWADEGSIIENATIGLRNYGPGINPPAGGILRGTGAIFRNNGIGVDFKPYENFNGSQPSNDRSSFRLCTLETTSSYLVPSPFTKFINLDGVNGIRVIACVFENDLVPSTANHYEDFGIGIYANNSGFLVSSLSPILPCLPPINCGSFTTFKGLGHAIEVTNITRTRPYSIIQAEIESCWRGITINGASGGTILFNTIEFGNTPAGFATAPEDQIGIELHGYQTGFQIQENVFTYNSGGTTNAIGIKVSDIGEALNIIRRNSFMGLDIVHEAYGLNAVNTEIGSSGLIFLCENSNNTQARGFEFYIAETGGVDNIYYLQGLPGFNQTLPAGNDFAYTATDIFNQNAIPLVESIQYFWYDSGNQEPLTGSGYLPYERFTPNDCASTYCVPPCITQNDISSVKEDYYNSRNQSLQDIDDYWIAEGNSDFTLSSQKNLSAVYHTQVGSQKAYDLVQYFWHDTVNFNLDTLITWYGNLNTFASDVMIGTEIAYKDGFGDALDYLEDIPNNRDLTIEQENDLEQLITIYSILDTTEIPDLSKSQKNIMRSIAQNARGRSSCIASAVLNYFGENFPLPYFMGEVYDPPLQRRGSEEVNAESSFTIQPMPANSTVTIKWINEESLETQRNFYLSSLLGELLITDIMSSGESSIQLDISSLLPGIYTITSFNYKSGAYSKLLIVN